MLVTRVTNSEIRFSKFHEKWSFLNGLLAILAELFAPYASLPFDDAAATVYGRLRHDLERAGGVIGPNDLMIASIALVHNLTLVTHNTAEFRRVAGLQLKDWQS